MFRLQFFHPIRVAKVLIEFGPDGRLSGEAAAHFTTRQDAVEAMTRDKQYMSKGYEVCHFPDVFYSPLK